jgi:hypothetical protein
VLDNDASPLFEATVATRPAGESLTATIELIAFVLAAVLFTAVRRWAAEQGTSPLAILVDQAVTTIEPLVAALG